MGLFIFLVLFGVSCLLSGMSTIVYQGSASDCGLAALKSLLIAVSHDKNYRYLTADHGGPFSLAELIEMGKKEGLALEFRRVASKAEIENNPPVPFIALLGEENVPHAVVVSRIGRKSLTYLDPAEGPVTVKKTTFIEKWNGIFSQTLSYEKKPCPYRKESIKPLGSIVLAVLLEMGADAFLMCGFFYMNNEGNFLSPVLCFTGFALTAILRRCLETQSMKKFDERWLPLTYDSNENRFKDNYVHYHEFKKALFVSPLAFASAFFLLAALSFLIGANNPSYFIALSAIGVFEGVAAILFSGRLRGKRRSLSREEESLLASATDRQTALLRLQSINQTAYKIGDEISYLRIVTIAVCLASTFACFYGQTTITLNFFLFHFFALLSAAEQFERLFEYLMEEPIRQSEDEYFRQYLAKKRDP